jgi:predicted SprT family Zn-dependent metalloprotease
VTNKWLKDYYLVFNKRYFGNKLPKDAQIIWSTKTTRKRAAQLLVWKDTLEETEIALNPMLKKLGAECRALQSLLHEMCHLYLRVLGKPVSVYTGHGRLWNREMKRLAACGAFKTIW